MVYRKLLPRESHGTIIVYANIYQDHYARHHQTLKVKTSSRYRWLGIHGNHPRNVWTPKSGHSGEQFNHTMHMYPRLPPSKTYARIVAPCMAYHLVHIGCQLFLSWICWK